MKPNYQLTIIILLIISTLGCRSITCEEFDFNRSILDWHFFPDLEMQYVFTDSLSNELILDQTLYEENEFEERCCHMCACFQFLNTTYENQNIDLNFTTYLNYNSDLPDLEGTIQYLTNNRNSVLQIEGNTLIELASESREKTFEISELQSILLLGQEFNDIVQFEIVNVDMPRVTTLWVKKNIGLLGFKFNGQTWVKK